ncbi:MAG TPA: ABC transporter permease [Actinobacteria bacterium]|mgnify:CR=1 FL=1|nr:ABC transporter permease [Actinomycetota bacterium]
MTATTPARGGGTLVGTGSLVRMMLRRDRVKLPSWILGISLFWLYYTRLVPTAYPTRADLDAIVGMMGGATGRMWTGPTYFLDNMTYETFIPAAYGGYLILVIVLMSILLIVRHTRVEEQTGRAELVRASVVGRHAPLTAALLVALIANGATAGLIAIMMIADPIFSTGGSLLFVAGCFASGLAFAGLTAAIVQVTEYSRTATSLAAGAGLGGAFLIKAFGDMGHEHGTLLSWFSPMAWPQQTAPFVLDRWWPLTLSVAFAVATAALGYWLAARRDVGAGLIAPRAGKARAKGWLGTPVGLAWRLERRTIMWWAIGLGVLGMSMGAFAERAVPGEMPEALLVVLDGAENITAGYLAYMGVFMASIVAIYAVLAMQGLRAEETGGRGEPVLAAAVSRWSWLGANLLVGTIGVVVIMGVAGAMTGLGAASVLGDNALIWEVTAAHLNHVPPILVVLGVAALLFGLLPRATGASWALVAYGFIMGTFGALMDLPDVAFDISPFEHPARMPLEEFELVPVAVLVAIAVALVAVGLAAFRRRDLDVT